MAFWSRMWALEPGCLSSRVLTKFCDLRQVAYLICKIITVPSTFFFFFEREIKWVSIHEVLILISGTLACHES